MYRSSAERYRLYVASMPVASTAMSRANNSNKDACTRRLTTTENPETGETRLRHLRGKPVAATLIRLHPTPQPETMRRFVSGRSSAPFGNAPRVCLLGFQN